MERLILQNPDLVKQAGTIEELAEKSGLPSEVLATTIRRYNELVDQGEGLDFGRFGEG